MSNVTQMHATVPEWDFADRVRKVRRDRGLTQGAFADLIGVGRQRYSAWEAGRNTPSDILAVARQLERATNVDKLWFLGWMDSNSPAPTDPQGTPATDQYMGRPRAVRHLSPLAAVA